MDTHSEQSQSGMTLVEVCVVSAIMMVLALGMATFMKHFQDGSRAVEAKANYNGLGNAVRSVASQPNSLVKSIELTD